MGAVDARPVDPRINQLFVKALRSLSADEQDDLAAYLFGAATTKRGGPPAAGNELREDQSPSSEATSSDISELARLLAEGRQLSEIAAELQVPEELVRRQLPAVAWLADRERGSTREVLALGLLAKGLTRREVAEQLEISEKEVTNLVLTALARKSAVSPRQKSPWPPEGVELAPVAALRAGRQMVPVRLSEDQHRRLKEWCRENGFSMAVVIRGLVERFLDEQGRGA